MKITACILLLACLHLSAATFAQKITLRENNVPLEKVFKQIRQQTTYNFVYTSDAIKKAHAVTINVQNGSIDDVLSICFKDQPLTYSQVDNVIVIKELNKAVAPSPAQTEPVRGKVTDAKGQPLAGATVRIRGTNKGVATDQSGNFTINANKGDILVISEIGYTEQQVKVADNASISVTLMESQTQLNQVVVTALGIKRQTRALGYSTTELGGDKFTQSRETNLGNALTGQVAGVAVAGVATGPAGSSRVVIRGNASLKGNNQPLYVIDGVPYDNTTQGYAGQYGGSDFGDGLDAIDPDDIQSIQVLKGVAASALYGYRGGNGAILITTKSGAKTKGIGIELNDNFTLNSVMDLRDDLQYEYGQGLNGLKPTNLASGSTSATSSWGAKLDGSDFVDFTGKTRPYVAAPDNYENFFNKGLTNQTSVALSGGNENGHFRLGLSDMYLKDIFPNATTKQQGINFNSDYNITPKLELLLNANYTFEQAVDRPSFSDSPGNAIATVDYLASSFDVRWLKPGTDANGMELVPNADDVYTDNPYFVVNDFKNYTNRNRLTGGVTLKYKFFDWLFLQGQVTRDGYIIDHTEITPTGTAFITGGSLTQYKTDFHELNYNFLLDFNKKFDAITVHANFGGNDQDNIRNAGGIYGAGPFQVPYFYSASNIVNKPFTYTYARYKVNSLFGDLDLGYKNFLFLTGTLRNDWFSTLSPKSNRYLYPSVSASFVFTDAWKLPDWVSFGKLRASYAQSSNGTSPYENLLTYIIQGYSISGQPIGVVGKSEIPNPNLKPVQIDEKEVGLNMEFLNNRVGFDVAYYSKKTTNDILDVGVSDATAYGSDIVNIGRVRNQGIELLLNGTPVHSEGFTWNSSFNIAVNNNKVLSLAPGLSAIPVNDDAFPRWGDNVSIQHVVGLPYAQIMGYAYKRNAKGQIVYDADGYPETSSDVPVPLGSAMYKTTGGFSNDFSYKHFTLSVLIDFKYGAKLYSGTNLLYYENGQAKETLPGRSTGGFVGPGVNDAGQPNTVAVRSQDYFYGITIGDHQISEPFVYDASFIKLRSASLQYAFPQKMLQGTFIKGLSLSLVGRNLAILMKHTPNIDPESNLNNTNAQGLELAGYPSVRSFGFNLNAKF